MILIDYAQTHPNELISVVSESYPHLKRGAMRDFLNIMEDRQYFRDNEWNKTDSTYEFKNKSKIEFFSVDQPEKVKGARRDVLFINEANNITKDSFDQLEVRTKKVVWLDWNPVQEFWFYTDTAITRDHDFLTLNYMDNEALEQSIVDSIEARKGNKMWWTVYGLGQLGDVEGRIYTDWQILDQKPSFPHEAKLYRYGLDFGYTNDPTAIVAIYQYNNGYILDEMLYQRGLSNKAIADFMNNKEKALVIADSAEPKSIDEINSYGINIIPAVKGKDSVVNGIQFIQDQRISVTKRSLNLIKEYRNYMWETDRDGKIINVPSELFNHCMDAIRYALASGRSAKWVAPTDFGGVKPFWEEMPG